MKVIRVDEREFELEDGRVYEHAEMFDEAPNLEEFQKLYGEWEEEFKKMGLIKGS